TLDCDWPAYVALIVTVASVATVVVVWLSITWLAPAGTVTVAGTGTDGSLLARPITASLDAARFKLTVILKGLPPVTAVGLTSTPATASPGVAVAGTVGVPVGAALGVDASVAATVAVEVGVLVCVGVVDAAA